MGFEAVISQIYPLLYFGIPLCKCNQRFRQKIGVHNVIGQAGCHTRYLLNSLNMAPLWSTEVCEYRLYGIPTMLQFHRLLVQPYEEPHYVEAMLLEENTSIIRNLTESRTIFIIPKYNKVP